MGLFGKTTDQKNPQEPSTSSNTNEQDINQENKFPRITVEPLIFLMMLCYGLLVPLELQYLTKRFSDKYNRTDHDYNYCSNVSDEDDAIQGKIQQETALWAMYLSAATALPGIFTTTSLGSYSDRAGRKIALVLPCIGFTLYSVNYIVVIFHNLRIEHLLIGHFIQGMSGGFTLFLTGCFSYMADITTKKQRMIRIVVLDLFGFIGAGASQIAVGFWIDFKGFWQPFLFILCIVLCCTLYSLFGITDTIIPDKRQSLSPKKSLESLINFFQNNSNDRRWRIILLLLILFLRMVVFFSLPDLTLLYGLGEPFCWDSITIGFFNAGQYVIGATGMLIGGRIISKVLSEPSLMQLGFVSSILSILLTALAPNTLAFFFVILVGLFRALSLPMVRSLMSKLVFPSEHGIMFACVGCIQGLTNFLSPLIFNTIFYASVKFESNIAFYTMIGVLVIASLLTLILQIKQQDSSYMVLRDPREDDHLTKSTDVEKSYESSTGNVSTQRR